MSEFPKYGYVRLKQIIAPYGPIPVSKSTWYAGVKSGRFPSPARKDGRMSMWNAHDIRSYVDEAA